MGDTTDVDTSSFRAAIRYYIHCMFGIRHDDYDYIAINQLLERNLKAYIKTATCFPERVTKRDYDSFMREFKHSEKVRHMTSAAGCASARCSRSHVCLHLIVVFNTCFKAGR